MNLSEVQRVLAKIQEHRFVIGDPFCGCGFALVAGAAPGGYRLSHEAHLASVLAPETDKALSEDVKEGYAQDVDSLLDRFENAVASIEQATTSDAANRQCARRDALRLRIREALLPWGRRNLGGVDEAERAAFVVGSSKEEQALTEKKAYHGEDREAPPSPPSDPAWLFDALWRVLPFPIRHYFGGDEREAREGVVAMMARGFTATQEQLEAIMRANQVSEPSRSPEPGPTVRDVEAAYAPSRSTLSPTPEERERLAKIMDGLLDDVSSLGLLNVIPDDADLAAIASYLRLPSGEQEAPKGEG